jgi:hypothetical protein
MFIVTLLMDKVVHPLRSFAATTSKTKNYATLHFRAINEGRLHSDKTGAETEPWENHTHEICAVPRYLVLE